MLLGVAHSINNVPVRLTVERWDAILNMHPYDFSYHDYEMVLDAVADPDYIVRANAGALFAVVVLGRRRYLHVLYRKLRKTDGFIITAYIDPVMFKGQILWRRDDHDG